ncbi:MAG: hypothetical protein QM727_05500 [Niabella sp.]
MSNQPFFKLFAFTLLSVITLSCSKSPETTLPKDTGTTTPQPDNQDGNNGGESGSASYGDLFLYGSNMGYYPGWTDEQLSEILIGSPNSEGAGVNSLRPAMYDRFVEEWGYNIRSNAFKFYQQLGGKDHVIFLNGPSDAHRDKTKYCASHESGTFANLYEPIWTNDGQINDKNYYALYVYNVVKTYGPYVKFWEVWNEPDYTNNWAASQTWANTDPNPCDLDGFYAPVQSYVRMLRITYEVVKKLDPTDQVCLGGIGYEGFLDAIMRNTDNPSEGAVTSAYPQKGGAWFDCVSYHIYPMYSLGGDKKNSDAAAQTIVAQRNNLEAVLKKYQYGGKKSYIVTECNIPRKALNGYIGGDEAQRNFMIKAAVMAQKSEIKGLYIYGAAESETLSAATEPYQVMGFYQKMPLAPYKATINPSGVSWRTASRLLGNRHYDKAKTDAMQLPSTVDGAAFYSTSDKNYIYVLWAKSSGNSESASASYSFPASFNITSTTQYSWEEVKSQANSNNFKLTGSPIFIKP